MSPIAGDQRKHTIPWQRQVGAEIYQVMNFFRSFRGNFGGHDTRHAVTYEGYRLSQRIDQFGHRVYVSLERGTRWRQ